MVRLDERQIILLFHKMLGTRNFVSEDVETIKVGKKLFVAKTDTLVASTDVPRGMKIHDVARKSIVSCVSDFAAKGVVPSHCILSLSLPRSFSKTKLVQLARGFKKSADEFSFKVIGGDTNEANDIVISVFMIGTSGKIVRRGGAARGDAIIVTGQFGLAPSGLHIIQGRKKASSAFAKIAKSAVYRPSPRLRFGILAAKYFTSSMDSSDGLSTTLNEMARQSGKKFKVTKIPSDPMVEAFAKENSLRLFDLIFNGGEEYEIVATVPQKMLDSVRKIAAGTKTKITVIGHVEPGNGVFLMDSKSPIEDRGWSHFTSRR